MTPIRFSITAALAAKALAGVAIVALAAGAARTVMAGSVNQDGHGHGKPSPHL